MRRALFPLVLVSIGAAALAGACATGVVAIDFPDAGLDGSGCPQFDLTKDPQHCGACDKACPAGEVCSQAQCKAQCDLPTTKCTSADGGAACVDTKTDPGNCGQCGTKCALPDAGGLQQGTNNPDSGIPFDAGGGPFASAGTASCTAGTCGVACPGTMTKCTDGFCWDTQNQHEHCGDCNTACGASEWCALGHCCATGKLYCGSACVDVLSDPANCGGCGVACSGGTPYCSNGKCVMGCVPSGTRQAFNVLQSSTTTGCWNGNPCTQDAYSFSSTYGKNFQSNGQELVCSGPSACVGHVGVGTYTSTTVCQGAWDVYCDATKVGNINTVGKACTGSAMSNGCNVTFTPQPCTTIKLVATAGSGTMSCCGGASPDSMIVAVSAW